MPTSRASTKPDFRGFDFVMLRQDRRPPAAHSSEMLYMTAIIRGAAVRRTRYYQGILGVREIVYDDEMARDVPYGEETEKVVRC